MGGDSVNKSVRLEEELELTSDKLKTTRRDAEQCKQTINALEQQLHEHKDEIEDLQEQIEHRDLKIDSIMQENAVLLEENSQIPQKDTNSNLELEKALDRLNLKAQQLSD